MNFETQLKAKKLKVTPQRMAILSTIYQSGHIGIEEIYEKIKKDYPSISLATIYKNIASLHEANILREVKVPSQKQKYELACEKHLHVACEKCGKLEDVYFDVESVLNECSNATDYKIHDMNAMFIGVCAKCANS
ncbi:Fur family transcriptional regulator [Helicobacter anatolicus]|uniref:Fur family transcriptional regulator n=1 Tax=Helicobacter anatolicus TaxID=2905874 RepID=UPI001E620E05|nr:transcriptional repressor [Helicobacter anatolicus]MCE3037783.1 transcriptional repressor [Helicobacter anatolicus]